MAGFFVMGPLLKGASVGSDGTSQAFGKFALGSPMASMAKNRGHVSTPPVMSLQPFSKSTGSAASLGKDLTAKALSAGVAAVVALSAGMSPAHAGPFTQSEIASLTYEQIKGTGLANTCPIVEKGGGGDIKTSGLKSIDELCLEPLSFQVLEEET